MSRARPLDTPRHPKSCLEALRSLSSTIKPTDNQVLQTPPDTQITPESCLEALRPLDTTRHPKSCLEALRSCARPPDTSRPLLAVQLEEVDALDAARMRAAVQ
jgi:hypothetical protein